MSHFGRPNGEKVDKYSLRYIVPEVEKQLGTKVAFADDCVGSQVEDLVNQQTNGGIVLLDNLRFHIEEEGSRKETKKGADGEVEEVKIKADKGDVDRFRQGLTALGDVYISELVTIIASLTPAAKRVSDDAFGTAHRAHSSMVGVHLPQRAAGALMKKELDYFAQAVENPKRDFVALLGGSKVSDKIQLIKNMLDKVNTLVIFGAMTYTFSQVNGVKIGSSRFDKEGAESVNDLKAKAQANFVHLIIPEDHLIAQEIDNNAETKDVTDKDGIPDGWLGLDIGPESIKKISDILLSPTTQTVLWNGPAGVFEVDKFAKGTKSVMDAAVEAAKTKTVIIGGGDTAAAAAKYDVEDKLSHVSTGGGASLELLEGKQLPGVAALSTK